MTLSNEQIIDTVQSAMMITVTLLLIYVFLLVRREFANATRMLSQIVNGERHYLANRTRIERLEARVAELEKGK